jgi:hypothetical protein
MADKREIRTSEAPAVYRSYFTPPFPVRTTFAPQWDQT